MRALLALALVAALLVAADRVVAQQVEARAEDAVAALLEAPVSVRLRGFPLVWHLLSGRVPEAVLVARDVPVGERGARLPLLRVVLRDVEVSATALGGGRLPPAAAGTFEAQADGPALLALAGAVDRALGVELGDGTIRLRLDGVVLRAVPDAAAGRLVLRPVAPSDPPPFVPLPELQIDLTGLEGRPVIDQVAVTPGRLVLTGRLTALPLSRR